jgi:hypothetical protein
MNNLKNIFPLLILLMLVIAVSAPAAALTADTDLARGSAAFGTFSDPDAATDGVAAADKAAASGNVIDSPQFLTVDLASPAYIQRVKIFWDKDAYSNSYDIRTSSDSKNWFTELANADAGTGAVDERTGTISQTITGKRFGSLSRYVQIYIPLGSRLTNPTGKSVRIAEVQVFPAAEQKIAIEDVSAYAVTDKKAVITISSNIGATRASLSYGPSPDKLEQSAAVYETGRQSSATLYNLEPGRSCYYQARVWDAYGSMAESPVKNFAPARENAALGKKVLGTFSELPPRDSFVNKNGDVLARVTDGGTSYFTAMATSRSVNLEDQYAIIDLGKSSPISNVVTYWRNLAYPLEFDISISNDGVNFGDGAAGLNAGSGAFSRSDTGDPMRVVSADLKGTLARYVKVLVKKGAPCFQKHADWDFVQLMEVEVYPQ